MLNVSAALLWTVFGCTDSLVTDSIIYLIDYLLNLNKCYKTVKTVLKYNFYKPHPGISLILYLFLENILCLCLKLWDMRKGTSIMDLKHHEDYISDIAVDQAKRILLTTR